MLEREGRALAGQPDPGPPFPPALISDPRTVPGGRGGLRVSVGSGHAPPPPPCGPSDPGGGGGESSTAGWWRTGSASHWTRDTDQDAAWAAAFKTDAKPRGPQTPPVSPCGNGPQSTGLGGQVTLPPTRGPSHPCLCLTNVWISARPDPD